jgi:effector-binding domain-containing protein
MSQALGAAVHVPELVEVEPRQTAVVHVAGDVREFPSLLGDAFEATMQQITVSGGQAAGPPFARYFAFGDHIEAEVGFPYIGTLIPSDRVRGSELPGGKAALLTHVGGYDDIARAWESVSAWVHDQGFEPASPPWESYLTGPGDAGLPVTQIVFPIR